VIALPVQTVQLPIFRGNEDLGAAVAVQIGQDRLADAPSQRHRPEQARLPVALAQSVQRAVVAPEQHLRPPVRVQIGGDHPADRPTQVQAPALVVPLPRGNSVSAGQVGHRAGAPTVKQRITPSD